MSWYNFHYFYFCLFHSSRKQELDSSQPPKQPGKPPDPGRPIQPGLSKSRTTDTLRSEQKLPGRSPSTISLKESKSRTDFKDEHKSSVMPGFLSEVNPLSAVSSVVNKFNPFDLISDPDASQEEASKKQKIAQKEQGKPEGVTKPPSQQQSPKTVPKQPGPVRAPLHQEGSPKSGSSQPPEKSKLQPPETGKPAQGFPQAPQTDQAKLPLQRDVSRPQTKQTDPGRGESAKPSLQSPSKPPIQQGSPGKSPAQQPGPEKRTIPQPGPAKPLAQQLGTAKPLAQAPGAAKSLVHQPGPQSPAQPPGPAKHPAQQVGTTKPQAQLSGLGKTPPQQPGPTKPPPQQPGPVKPPPQQLGPAKPSPQQPGPAKPPPQQPGPPKPPPQQPGPAKPPPQQPGPAKPSAQQSTKPVSQTGAGKPLQPPTFPSAAQTPVHGLPKTICPLCNTTELLLHVPEKANFNTCTECQTTVCSLCGFNPNPHLTEVSSVFS